MPTTRREMLGAGLGLAGLAALPAWADPARVVDLQRPAPGGRIVPVRVFLPPAGASEVSTIVFSHGALSSGALYDALLSLWAAGPYVILAPTHVDSETNADRAKYDGPATLALRLEDMRMMADQRDGIVAEASPVLVPKLVPGAIGAAGHSYGALIAEMLVGATVADRAHPGGRVTGLDARISCAVAISPPADIPGFTDTVGWSSIAAPTIVTTGTADKLPGMAPEWQMHLASYEGAPPGNRYSVIGEGVDHYYGGEICRLDRPGPKQTAALAEVAALTRLFLDAHLRAEATALAALEARAKAGQRGLLTVATR